MRILTSGILGSHRKLRGGSGESIALRASFKSIIEEGLLILGGLLLRPLKIFPYDWWPIAQRRDLYRRLSEAAIELRTYAPNPAKGRFDAFRLLGLSLSARSRNNCSAVCRGMHQLDD